MKQSSDAHHVDATVSQKVVAFFSVQILAAMVGGLFTLIVRGIQAVAGPEHIGDGWLVGAFGLGVALVDLLWMFGNPKITWPGQQQKQPARHGVRVLPEADKVASGAGTRRVDIPEPWEVCELPTGRRLVRERGWNPARQTRLLAAWVGSLIASLAALVWLILTNAPDMATSAVFLLTLLLMMAAVPLTIAIAVQRRVEIFVGPDEIKVCPWLFAARRMRRYRGPALVIRSKRLPSDRGAARFAIELRCESPDEFTAERPVLSFSSQAADELRALAALLATETGWPLYDTTRRGNRNRDPTA